MLNQWEEARITKQFTYLVGPEKYIILSEVKKILGNTNISTTEKLHRRRVISETFLAQVH